MSGPRASVRIDDRDRDELERRGIDERELSRQLELLTRGRSFAAVDRPCSIGDGIERLDDLQQQACLDHHRRAVADGRFAKFVPASGAATRMFKDLQAARRSAAGNGADLVERFARELDRFAFADEVRGSAGGTQPADLVDAILDENRLDYPGRPKGLLPFHRGPGGRGRTPFEEHLAEAIATVRDAKGRCRLHFTVSPEHRRRFEEHLAKVIREHDADGARFDVEWSEQDPGTDTVVLDGSGGLARDAAGALLFRPGGHGSLIRNLAGLDPDVVYVKNIDNVQPESRAEGTWRWKRVLGGHLVRLEDERRSLWEQVERGEVDRARLDAFLQRVGRPAPGDDGDLRAALDRPLRVCGVVENTGEPGGGPFWVRGAVGPTAQIIETAQIDVRDPAQREALQAATHFNPVDLVCALRSPAGEVYEIERFVDPDAAIVTSKAVAGRERRVLERPGLWNGAMAGWLTAFVEVPLATFSPVKTVFDLLRPEHQS